MWKRVTKSPKSLEEQPYRGEKEQLDSGHKKTRRWCSKLGAVEKRGKGGVEVRRRGKKKPRAIREMEFAKEDENLRYLAAEGKMAQKKVYANAERQVAENSTQKKYLQYSELA